MGLINHKLRRVTAKVSTPICGAKLSELKCDRHDPTRCSWMCIKDIDADYEQLDLFDREELSETDMEDMYAHEKCRKDLTSNMDRAEWEGR